MLPLRHGGRLIRDPGAGSGQAGPGTFMADAQNRKQWNPSAAPIPARRNRRYPAHRSLSSLAPGRAVIRPPAVRPDQTATRAGGENVGRRKKYTTAAALEKGVEAYFRSISYQEPVIVLTPTGSVDPYGHEETVRMMLRAGPDGTGKPVTRTKWIEPPGLAGLCLRLGISKETWSQYARDERLGPVTERAKLLLEQYWNGRLDGPGAHGAKFVLTNNFGWDGIWADKVESTQRHVEMSMEEYLEGLDAKGEGQVF